MITMGRNGQMGISNIISLLSGVALFLFGMALMGDGLKKVAGNKLEVVLYRLTSTPLKGFLLGTGVTAVIQSSSATSVMVVGCVNSGMMKVRQAIGIVLGAILGTSITGWVLCLSELGGGSSGGWVELFSTATLTGVISVAGIVLRMFSHSQSRRHIGDILMGFAVLMFGMSAMSEAVSPLRESPVFIQFLVHLSNPLLGILFGIVFTSVIQSASAAVGILQALASTGVIDFAMAFPVIMGIAIGAAVPVLISAIGANVDGRRTALVYLVVETVGVIFWAAVFYIANAAFHFSFLSMPMTAVSIAALNTLFRLVKVLILMPFIDVIEALVNFLIPDRGGARKQPELMQLEERFLQHPALAIEQSRICINAMAAEARENLFEAFKLRKDYSDTGFDEVERMESTVDRYEDTLGSYLVKLTGREMSDVQNEEVSKFLHTLSDFERISDHALNIAENAKEIHEKALDFSPQAQKDLNVIESAVMEIVRLTIESFIRNDVEMAKHVEPLEELIDNLCDEIKLRHVDRLQHGICTIQLGFVFNDLLTNYERVADHCSNIAVAMIELESDLFDTHEYLNSVKELKSGSFTRLYEDYSRKFRLDEGK